MIITAIDDRIEPEKGRCSRCSAFPSVASIKPHNVPKTAIDTIDFRFIYILIKRNNLI